MLYIDSVPPKSVDRTYFYETFTISTSRGLVNPMAANAALDGSLWAGSSPNTPIAIKPSPQTPAIILSWLPLRKPSTRVDPGEANGFVLPSSVPLLFCGVAN